MIYFIRTLLSGIVLAGVAVGSSAVRAQTVFADLSSRPVGKIYFESLTPKTTYALQKHADQQPVTKVAGTLYLPEGSRGPVPAMVITPGSGGVMTNQTERWKPLFLSLGMAVFIVDTLGSRSIESTVANQAQLSYAADISDSLSALKLLATDPRIDPRRIGQIGFSRGGAIALDTMVQPFRRAIIKDEAVRFAVHIAVYPACDDTYWNGKGSLMTGVPLLLLMGEKDEAVSNKLCQIYVDKLRAVLPQVETHTYDGAHHDFDAITSNREWLGKGINNLSCSGRDIDPDDWSVTQLGTGKRYVSFAEYMKDNPDYCGKRGYSIAGNPAAARQAEDDVAKFLGRTMKLN